MPFQVVIFLKCFDVSFSGENVSVHISCTRRRLALAAEPFCSPHANQAEKPLNRRHSLYQFIAFRFQCIQGHTQIVSAHRTRIECRFFFAWPNGRDIQAGQNRSGPSQKRTLHCSPSPLCSPEPSKQFAHFCGIITRFLSI